jgi:hypothetical protein
MGIFCVAGTLSFYVSVKHTSASNASQHHYTQLMTGALISYLVWHDKPGLPILVGGLLIIGSGLTIALAARKPRRYASRFRYLPATVLRRSQQRQQCEFRPFVQVPVT